MPGLNIGQAACCDGAEATRKMEFHALYVRGDETGTTQPLQREARRRQTREGGMGGFEERLSTDV